jgi:hypothetical protein
MSIDNLDNIKPLLEFSEPGDFYMLYVLKRKKDQPVGERDNHQSVRNIKSYSIENHEYLDKRWPEIKHLCEMFRARAYIHIQKQNHSEVAHEMMINLAKRIKSGHWKQTNLFDSIVGKIPTKENRWIVDIDTKSPDSILEIRQFLHGLRPIGDKVILEIPTKNGCHLICNRFDLSNFKRDYPDIDVQKKNPTLLYYPNSLDQ